MPTKAQIEQAIRNHFEAWNAKDKARWLANFADGIRMEDPVGGLPKVGREALEKSWTNSFKDGHDWKLEVVVMQICADQAALHVKNHGVVDRRPVELDSIEIYTIDDAGKVAYVRTYFNPPDGQQLDPYFLQQPAGG
ncbi:MAG TPA: nuclear transport factor 2 family protein [Nevskiaceae bacterium]|nr:nuclear transport factor 2 family protein [Nevskiaceae bacterium]